MSNSLPKNTIDASEHAKALIKLGQVVLGIGSETITGYHQNSGKNGKTCFYWNGRNYKISTEDFDLIVASGVTIFGGFARDLIRVILQNDQTLAKFEPKDLDLTLRKTKIHDFDKTCQAILNLFKVIGFEWSTITKMSESDSYQGLRAILKAPKLKEEIMVEFVCKPGNIDFDVNALIITELDEPFAPTFGIRKNAQSIVALPVILDHLKSKQFTIHAIKTGADTPIGIYQNLGVIARIFSMRDKGWSVKGTEFCRYTMISVPSCSSDKCFECKDEFDGKKLAMKTGCCKATFHPRCFQKVYRRRMDDIGIPYRVNDGLKSWLCPECHKKELFPWFK